MVTALDEVVGNLTQKLKDVGIYQSTIIVFSSDNGGIFGFGGNKPLKGNEFLYCYYIYFVLLFILNNTFPPKYPTIIL